MEIIISFLFMGFYLYLLHFDLSIPKEVRTFPLLILLMCYAMGTGEFVKRLYVAEFSFMGKACLAGVWLILLLLSLQIYLENK